MEQDFLDKLYFGKIVPWEKHKLDTTEMLESSKEVDSLLEKLSERLDDEGKKLLDQLMDARSDMTSVSEREAFKEGFRLGAEFTLNTFHNDKKL